MYWQKLILKNPLYRVFHLFRTCLLVIRIFPDTLTAGRGANITFSVNLLRPISNRTCSVEITALLCATSDLNAYAVCIMAHSYSYTPAKIILPYPEIKCKNYFRSPKRILQIYAACFYALCTKALKIAVQCGISHFYIPICIFFCLHFMGILFKYMIHHYIHNEFTASAMTPAHISDNSSSFAGAAR